MKSITPTTRSSDVISESPQMYTLVKSPTKKILFVLFLALLVGVVDMLTNHNIRDSINLFLVWVENNPKIGFFVFALVYATLDVLFFPPSILTLGGGFVFANTFGLGKGVLFASAAVFLGAVIGSLTAFSLGRYVLRDWVEAKVLKDYPIFGAIDAAINKQGLRIMVLLRLSPILPFTALNYFFGVSAVKFRHFVWAMAGMLPVIVLYVFIGASAGSLADSTNTSQNSGLMIAIIVVGIILGFLAIAVTSYYAKLELDEAIRTQNKEDEGILFV